MPAENPEIIDFITSGANRLLEFLEENANLKVSFDSEDNAYLVDISGGTGSAHLIGKHGKVLQSIQSLISNMVRFKFPDEDINVRVDVDGYQHSKKEKLLQRVDGLAQRVVDSGRDLEVENVNPLERRWIHQFIDENFSDKLITESIGFGRDRKLFLRAKG